MSDGRRGVHRHLYLLGLMTGAVGLAAILALLTFGPPAVTSSGEAPTSQVSLLQRPATARDVLPAGFETLPVSERLLDLSRARLAVEAAERRYYLAPAMANEICLLATSGEGAQLTSAGTCASVDRMAHSGIYLGEADAAGRIHVAMIVPDGVRSIRTDQGSAYPARSNVTLVPAITPRILEYEGGPFDGVAIETNFTAPPAK